MTSVEEEKRCPLCAEEMDWTDQQFNPCQCGYQVCVWCWHHIIDMAEKDETEGRCPACRAIYDKEKIVAMQSNCGRIMTKNSNRKNKPPKAKTKTNEVKKDLTNVRVIQRKMVYVIGLPLGLADEDLLQRKEYFGQYGKVDKVSLSRTAGGTIQQFINDTCSVYITYSKEEEAVRCIQAVHGFVLEGRYLRASFGTAKYCHAWLKNMPCNNPACLYLHSIGVDKDSFGKDEVAAVHTRSRVQQIVGAADNVVTRSGDLLPASVDDIYSSSAFTDRFAARNVAIETVHESVNSEGENLGTLSSIEKQGASAGSHKMTTFVDIVGRLNSSSLQKDENTQEDRISKLCSELSLVTMNGDIHAGQPYSNSKSFRVSSYNQSENGVCKLTPDELSREDSLLFENQAPKETCGSRQRSIFLPQPYPSPTLFRRKSLNDFSVDHITAYNREAEATLPIRCVNSVLNDAWQEMKFQNSSKSDRIYRNSSSFSNEEIVEHLRRIDDGNLTSGEKSSGLEAVENSIISNILSMDFDPWENSLTKTNEPSTVLDETRGLHGSSWNTVNSDQSGYSFVKSESFTSHLTGSVLRDFSDNKEQYLPKPQYPATRTQSFAPPGFVMPSRDPPPGFSTCERTNGLLPHASSVSSLFSPSFSGAMLQMPSTDYSSGTENASLVSPALLNCGKVKRANMSKSPSFELGQVSISQSNTYDDDRLWLMMQQQLAASAHQERPDSQFSRLFAPQTSLQQEHNYTDHLGNGISLDHIYGLSSRLVDQHQHYDPSFTHLSQQKYINPLVSHTNGYHFRKFDEFQHSNDLSRTEIGRNERLGINKYFREYGDVMFSSGDV